MRRKFYLLMLAVIFFAVISCGCSGGGGGFPNINYNPPVPYETAITSFIGHWHIVSGEARVYYPEKNLIFTAEYVPMSPDVIFTFNVSENDDNEYSTIAIDSTAITVDTQTGYRYITGAEFVNDTISDDEAVQWLIDNLKTSHLVIGSSEYIKIDENLYSMDIDLGENYSSVFTFTDPDTIIWEVRGSRAFYFVIQRSSDEELVESSNINGTWYITDGYAKIWNYDVYADYVNDSVSKFTMTVTQDDSISSDKYIILPTGAPVYQNSIYAVFSTDQYSVDPQKTIAHTMNSIPIVTGFNGYDKYEPDGDFDILTFYNHLVSLDKNFEVQDFSIEEAMSDKGKYVLPENPSEIYIYNITDGHFSVFWLENGDIDTLYWQCMGNVNYYVEMDRR